MDSLLAVASICGALGLLGFWRHRRRRLRWLANRCAYCNSALTEHECFRLEGAVICAACAERMRRRLRVADGLILGVIAIAVLGGIALGISLWFRGDPTWWLAVLLMEGFAVGFVGVRWTVIRGMKTDNIVGELVEQAEVLHSLLKDPENR